MKKLITLGAIVTALTLTACSDIDTTPRDNQSESKYLEFPEQGTEELNRVLLQAIMPGQSLDSDISNMNGWPVHYDDKGRITNINGAPVLYDKEGKIRNINGAPVLYNQHGKPINVNGAPILYDSKGRIKNINGAPVLYDENNNITNMNGAPVTYEEGKLKNKNGVRVEYQE